MEEPSRQLQDNLKDSLRASLLTQRPILTHLNADTSWLLQLPYPTSARRPGVRNRFNVLIDPWFQGPQSDVASWFSSQWHSTASSVQSIAELNDVLREIEELIGESNFSSTRTAPWTNGDLKPSKNGFIDLVVISHEFTDHCNQHTLLELDPSTPIIATTAAAHLIRKWRHFENVSEIPSFSASNDDWRECSVAPWLGISRMVTKSDALHFHSAVLITFDLTPDTTGRSSPGLGNTEVIIYSPHGIQAQDLRHLDQLPAAAPRIKTLALLYGLHDIRISLHQLNMGAHNGLQAQRICRAKYWVSTHDEVKTAKGMIAPLLHRKVLTFKEAIEQEKLDKGYISNESKFADMRELQFADLDSGESLLLLA